MNERNARTLARPTDALDDSGRATENKAKRGYGFFHYLKELFPSQVFENVDRLIVPIAVLHLYGLSNNINVHER
jgi:hypothetical protein